MLVLLFLISVSLNAAYDIKPSNHLNSSDVVAQSEQQSQEPPSNVVDYMVHLRSNLTDSNGKPTLANVEDPTEVWALQDSGTNSNNEIVCSFGASC